MLGKQGIYNLKWLMRLNNPEYGWENFLWNIWWLNNSL